MLIIVEKLSGDEVPVFETTPGNTVVTVVDYGCISKTSDTARETVQLMPITPGALRAVATALERAEAMHMFSAHIVFKDKTVGFLALRSCNQ